MLNGNHQHYQNGRHSDYPTSPWTELYQAMAQEQPEWQDAKCSAPKHDYDSEELRPTRDALTDIYNRGY